MVVALPSGVTEIGEWAFAGNNITEIVLPNGVGAIRKWTFSHCHELARITLPKGITAIGESVFYGSESLVRIYYGGTVSEWEKVSKASGWDENTGDFTVVCTDGEI
jgi:hypothetical protein